MQGTILLLVLLSNCIKMPVKTADKKHSDAVVVILAALQKAGAEVVSAAVQVWPPIHRNV